MSNRLRTLAAAICFLALASCASVQRPEVIAAAPVVHSPMPVQIPRQVPQGGLVFGTVPPGSRVELFESNSNATRAIRVSTTGRFVFGVGRDVIEAIQLRVTLPDATTQHVEVTVLSRTFPTEIVNGVPPETVTPPPEIAARIEREQARVAAARERDDDRDAFDMHFHWPVTGRISGEFGNARVYNGIAGAPHSGMDIAAAQGTPAHAPAAGVISFADDDLYLTGGTLMIDHGHGLSSTFLHLSRIDVNVGEVVRQDQVVGLVGKTGRATGPHLHWGMNWFGVRVDPHLLVNDKDNVPPASP